MKFQKKLSEIDDSILESIIAKCESRMVSPGEGKPFKSKAVAIELEPEEADDSEAEESAEPADEKKQEVVDKLSELDEDELVALYEKMKG
jgi:hypothetical protein